MRLPSGYGGIVKLSGRRRKPYAVRITAGWTDTGRQIYKYLDYFAKRTDALACLDEYNKNPYNVENRHISFNDLYKKWGNWKFAGDIPNSYQSAYKWCETLHKTTFLDIKADHIQDVIDKCSKGYSTKKNIRTLFNQLYLYAQRLEITERNYAKLTQLPVLEESRLHYPFTEKERKILWEHTADPAVRLALIYIYTGMRPTEFLKVKTENVYLDKCYLMGGMKTTAGRNRIIPLADKILPFIADMYNKKNEYLAIDHKDGKPILNYDRLRMHYWDRSPILCKMNHHPHDGRHTCATLLNNADVNKKTIQLILGHKSRDITDRVYTHKTIQQLIDAINLI